VITPRITRLVRVADLQGMHAHLAACTAAAEPRRTAIIVPTRGSAEVLRQTLEHRCLKSVASAIVLPDIVTRGEFYERLHARLVDAPPRLTDFEREVLFRRSALDAASRGVPPPFRLRAGLIVEMLAFYDELRRRDKNIGAFERLMTASLEPSADSDRGAERLLRLTRFLVSAFTIFEERLAAIDRIDEHGLRARLLRAGADALRDGCGYAHVVVTVADQAADPRGLWLADYDLLARMPGLASLDVLATENILATGFHQRIHDMLPGIVEERIGPRAQLPALAVPDSPHDRPGRRGFVCRDREEELVDVARRAKQRGLASLDRTAIVYQRPLPYLYLARQVFADAQLPYQALDALPLAAEPFAAAIDLVFSFLLAEGTRATLVALLASPHWRFAVADRHIDREDVAAADHRLREIKYVGGWDRLASLADDAADSAAAEPASRSARSRAARSISALRAAADAAVELRPILDATAASAQISALLSFITRHERLPQPRDSWHAGHLRARAGVLTALESLHDAHRLHDDAPVPSSELANTVRRWIEGQTFSPQTGSHGLRLLDAPSAAYSDVDELRLVGVVESDWPERSGRSIFYPASLLSQLGWPIDADRLAAARARFHDLLHLPCRRVSLSSFTLEDDAIVPASAFLEELDDEDLPIEREPLTLAPRIFLHEALAEEPLAANALTGSPREWLDLRASRSLGSSAMYHGSAGAREPAVYAVSSIERYLDCPFKYFAGHVLRLPEERAEESGLTPLERGQFLHEVFEAFFGEWQASGRGALTMENIADALSLFERIAERQLSTLPESDRALERTHLLGSAAAPGLAERAFAFEIEHGGMVIERLLEHELDGAFVFTTGAGSRTVRLRAKADRIDLLGDGTLRVVDYKLGKAPKPARALQLPIYGVCAQQSLEGRHGRTWTLGRAGYVAFREKNAFVALGGSSTLQEAVDAGQERLLAAIDAIEQGEFPPDPDEPFICTRCGYASVCRKDYVGDE
jgi:inactivated superfamily I helicase/CRISPR/Cas system-associated exonuclease Cas4 (RecB family)